MRWRRRGFLTGSIAAGGCATVLAGCRSAASSCPEPPDLGGPSGERPSRPPQAAASDADRFASLAGFCDRAQPIVANEFTARLDAVRERMAAEKIAGLVVESGAAMRYLGGPRWHRSERPLLLAIAAEGGATLVGSAFERHTYAGAEPAVAHEIEVWEEDDDPYALAVAAIVGGGNSKSARPIVATADTRGFVIEGLRRAAGRRGVQVDSELVDAGRRVKSAAELALLRRANEATKVSIAAAARHLQVGMHEREFAEIVAEAQRASGLVSPWVLALFGPNAAHPHGTAEGRTLAEGDLVLVDTGGFLHGYASDITRTFAFPEPAAIDDERKRAWDTVRAAQTAALETIAPGVRASQVDAAARAVLERAGYDPDYGEMTHRLGHGIGLEVHETPYLVRGSDRVLEVGNTMSDEPGIYRPGAFGIRLEDIVAVTDGGAEVFGPRAQSLADALTLPV